MRYFDSKAVFRSTLIQCNGLQKCDVKLENELFGQTSLTRNNDQFVYLQVACEQDPEMLELKNYLGLCSSILGLFIIIIFRNTISLYQGTNAINDKIYDGKLVTVGDFSVQGKIS